MRRIIEVAHLGRGSSRSNLLSTKGTDAAFVLQKEETMADQPLRQVAFDVAGVIVGLAHITDSVGNVAVPKAELIAELATYFQRSVSVESFTDLAYRPASG